MNPRVGVGILNFNRAALTIECLDHLAKIDWPPDQLQVVVVDNASSDDSLVRISRAHPEVRLVVSEKNRGFAGGCNLAIAAMEGVDYVALLNNDAFVEPGWLGPLVECLESHPDAGAACSKVLFAATYVDLKLESPCFQPLREDTRHLGVRVSGVEVNGKDRFAKCLFPEGFYGEEPGEAGAPNFRWTNGNAVLRVPFALEEVGAACRIRVSAETAKPLSAGESGLPSEFTVHSEPRWITLRPAGKPFDVINNAGSNLVCSRNAADRGIFEPDRAQFDRTEEVFAWCGCSVLLSKHYLDDVGLFDETLFLYYEDFDLSWRGRRRGWSHFYVPASVVRHLHAATSGEYSDTFNFYVQRNRLLILLKNGSLKIAATEAVNYGSNVLAQLGSDLRHSRLPADTRRQVRTLSSFLLHAPQALYRRLGTGARNRLSPRKVRTPKS